MASDKQVKKIIFITPSYIGDAVFTLPSLDYLKNKFKDAYFTVLSGPDASPLFANDPRIRQNIPYNKYSPFREKFALFNRLRKENFDVIIDLRDTLFRWFAPARYKNPYFVKIPSEIRHLRFRHLYKTMAAFKDRRNPEEINIPGREIYIDRQTIESADRLLRRYGLSIDSDYIVVAPGARSRTKRWRKEGFVKLCHELLKHYTIIFIGDKNDSLLTKDINKQLGDRVIDLAGETTLLEAVVIFKKAKLVICHDSAVLHIASYLDCPILAIFGPTDEYRSGPYSKNSAVVRKDTICTPCLIGDNCKHGWQCMRKLSPQLVIDYAYALLERKTPQPPFPYRRILLSRTDKLGDVLLSTPVIKNLREYAPSAYIAMMVDACLEDVVRANPYLDEVIAFEKKGKHRGIVNSIYFAMELRRKNFDLALILHPTVRIHLILFFAGIKKRMGYDRKCGFLNTHILKHTKQLGSKHEAEYALDFLKELGISDFDKSMFMSVYPEFEDWAENLLKQHKLNNSRVVVVHPQASCPSKLWPKDYFDRLVDDIIDIYKARIIYVGANRDDRIKEQEGIVNLTGMTNISQLASILKRSDLFISNDSGPVHMAVALAVPVISIFGRKQPGLGPKRWGPLGAKSVYLQKDVGCQVCLAHNCKKDFACLKSVDPKDVLVYVDKFLSK